MEGVSKQYLKHSIVSIEDAPIDDAIKSAFAILVEKLIAECQELQEPWIPVDGNTPKDRFLLCWIDDLQSKYILKFSTIRNTWLDQGLRPFMEPDLYQELPDDPVMPIHKPEPPR